MGFAKKLASTALLVGGALGALAIYNKMVESMAGELDTVLTGEERRYPWKYGDMFYSVKGARDAKPLLFIHGFGPGASSYEWRKNLDALAENFRVYAIDLLGYGLSDRPGVAYDAETYADLIHDFLREVINKPVTVIAHGQSCAFVIADAYRRPELFERLILVEPSPSILQENYPSPLESAWRLLLRAPIVGQALYNMLASRQAIRGYYDQLGYHNPGLISDELVEYVFTSAHQPGASFAGSSLLSNGLTMDVHEPFARLQVPVLAVWGREGELTPSEVSGVFKRVNSTIEVRIMDKSRYHLQDEQAVNFNKLVREFATNTPLNISTSTNR
ncbi:alpha/beta fold hydrolase [Ktedonospora formicarum]|uniref:Alpha/beta hydrolase n=1 Tax=Ktedonospora formicarum TaxID=2778364 RepID=A0A8J3I378_9CHLR|nr:alpha/beta fold hydrolase [Ktedonospora formicarum]GHO44644.1 alpha/beta hydrolase [Ktedonospora formicarum]